VRLNGVTPKGEMPGAGAGSSAAEVRISHGPILQGGTVGALLTSRAVAHTLSFMLRACTTSLTYDDVVLPAGRMADRLRAAQYRKFRGETWLQDLLDSPGRRGSMPGQRATVLT
jgi:hypothetical protein